MLTEEEKRELREEAASRAIRDEFRLLQKNSQLCQRVSVEQLARFLTVMSSLGQEPAALRGFVPYKSVKL